MTLFIAFLGTQAIEATTIALLLDDIGALQEEEPHQGNLSFLECLLCCKVYIFKSWIRMKHYAILLCKVMTICFQAISLEVAF